MKARSIVYDTWWPHRTGTVVKVTKTRTVVRWDDGGVWKYDKAHVKFLKEQP